MLVKGALGICFCVRSTTVFGWRCNWKSMSISFTQMLFSGIISLRKFPRAKQHSAMVVPYAKFCENQIFRVFSWSFSQILCNLQETFALWDEIRFFLFEVIRQILRSHRQQSLVELVKFEVPENFLENILEEWPEIWHADVSWPPSGLIRFWSRSIEFTRFGAIFI